MGSCLAREKSPRISEDAPVPQIPLDITIDTIPISELFDYVEHFDNCTYGLYQVIVDPSDITRALVILNADSKQSTYKQHQIRGNQQTIYMQLHNILSNGENVFIGAIHDVDNCLLITKVITGLAASVMVQELQSLNSIDDLEEVVLERNKDKYVICGSIIIQHHFGVQKVLLDQVNNESRKIECNGLPKYVHSAIWWIGVQCEKTMNIYNIVSQENSLNTQKIIKRIIFRTPSGGRWVRGQDLLNICTHI